MSKLDVILSRFPDFYEAQDPQKLLYGVLSALAAPLERLDRQLIEAMWSHWPRRAQDIQDLEQIAALYGVRRFDGEPRERFRQRLLALVRILLTGTATPGALLQVAAATLGLDVWDASGQPQLSPGSIANATLAPVTGRTQPLTLVETPWQAIEPEAVACVNGQRLGFHQDDFAPVVPTLVVTGVGERTVEPLVVNLTSGQAIGYLGNVPDGQRLVIRPDGTARLDGRDVSERLYALQGGFYDRDAFDQARARLVRRQPRAAFGLRGLDGPDFLFAGQPTAVQTPRLPVGDSEWAVTATIGRFGRTAFGRAVWDAPDPQVFQQGRFAVTPWDGSLFTLAPSLHLALRWQERERAVCELRVPWELVQRGPDRVDVDGWAYSVDPTAGILRVHRTRPLRFELYSRSLPAGASELTLGGNLAAGARGVTTGYFALLRARPGRIRQVEPEHASLGLSRRGSPIYLDDPQATLLQPPEGFDFLTLLRTAVADAASRADIVVRASLDLAEPGTLYVAYDALAVALPTWLRADQGWHKVGQTITATRDEIVYTLALGSAPTTLAWLEWTGEPPLPPPRLLVADAVGQLYVLDPAELQRLATGAPGALDSEVELARVPLGRGASALTLLQNYQPPDQPGERQWALVANFDDNSVTVVDLETVERLIVQDPAVTPADAVAATIPCGRGPGSITLTPDRHEAQVLNLLDHSLTRIDLASLRAVETQPATPPHERLARELERVRAAGIDVRVVGVLPDLGGTSELAPLADLISERSVDALAIVALGDGAIPPTDADVGLANEVFRKRVAEAARAVVEEEGQPRAVRVVIALGADEPIEGDVELREIGLFDAAGNLFRRALLPAPILKTHDFALSLSWEFRIE